MSLRSTTCPGGARRPSERAAIALGSLLAISACITPRSYASVVHRDLTGGVLALEGPDRAIAWRDADHKMRSQCGGDYRIVEEDRVRTGERTVSNTIAQSDAMLGYGVPYSGDPLGYPPGYALGYPPGVTMPYPWYPPGAAIAGGESDTETTPVYERRITYHCTGPRSAEVGDAPSSVPPSSPPAATPPNAPPKAPPAPPSTASQTARGR